MRYGIKVMAARIKKIRHDDETRAKIKTSQLINRLMDHIDGTIELSASQIRAAEILLKKTLPDLATVQHTGEVSHNFVARLPEMIDVTEEWAYQNRPPLQ